MADIKALAAEIAAKFHPEKIILFGSWAYGTPNEHSDVDILVVKSHRGRDIDTATKIRCALECNFALDLLVRSPSALRKRIEMGDPFIIEITSRGKILYEADYARMGRQGRGRLGNGFKGVSRQKAA
ncbi:MAG: nucleotidyltransferase domain-containing protein [Planctomycetes bacterium]|nr:nucleotidyltransferase domain-containing protein [Planctomycetota bacterium]